MTLSARGVTVSLGGHTVLDGIDLSVPEGAVTGLIGPNGAGKTTLLRAMAGVLPIASGGITLDNRALADWPRRDRARLIAYLPQGAPCSWPMDVRRIVALGRLPHLAPWRRPTARDEAAIEDALAAADVRHLAQRTVLTLSGGERARVMLGRALAVRPRVLLADEPVAGLDPEHQLRVMALLREQAAGGVAIIVTLHDLTLAARFCNRLVVLDHGHIAAEGPPEAVLTPPILASVFSVRAEHGHRGGQSFVIPWDVVPRLNVVEKGLIGRDRGD
ncbi:iron-dicitrate transporter subunit; ATP-binding component of ABC superfamily; KpLE2 phage-like element [Candidatus Defluviicoccus seviourii]|uniref:Iron-dicitrate transporter subunit ATP-binding component of ABC superfamily KpLE2 phage-like element n=2 Tax=root TaxID=1 RepID=A0A564WF20_9PROT|nr:iron-dicitrate transporter subunit; ATP-binding component of ABC superfamily; KpLE2 phage-like element [uncultured Defluviicoccus sp.]VUX47072.1 iron-dicitrate transporter subunit; ATP-binding component of ABC superfamily; KpLE2 phage-like element [Candidatus Defluviicoccus seviourii]